MCLITAGADINSTDIYGRTPLLYGARSRESRVVQSLLAAGADVQLRDNEGRTILDWAKFSDVADEMVKVLTEAGVGVIVDKSVGELA